MCSSICSNFCTTSSFRFYLRESQGDAPWLDNYGLDLHIFRDFIPFLIQPENREYPDLCQLLDLNEATLLENLRQRFVAGHIYTYVGSILIAVNPFKFYPIYNPKYVRLYQNQRVGPILPPHIFAIADNAYYCMLREKRNQVSHSFRPDGHINNIFPKHNNLCLCDLS